MYELNITATATCSKTVSTDVMLLLQIAEQFTENPSANGNITDSMTGEVLFIMEEGRAVYFAGAVDEALSEMLAEVMAQACEPDMIEIIAGIVS